MIAPQSHRLFQVITRLDGCKANGLLTTASNASTKDKAPYRVLFVRKPARFRPGNVVRAPSGDLILLLEHPSDHNWLHSFKAQKVDEIYIWKRPQKLRDPVSQVMRDNGVLEMGFVYATFEAPETLGLEKMGDTQYRFLTGADVQLDDVIDGKIVKKVVNVLGVKLVQVV